MRTLCCSIVLMFGALCFGQQSVTVTATRSISLAPDQALISINVTTPLDRNLDDVVAVLASSGVSSSNLTSIFSSESGKNATLQWTFRLAVPFGRIKDALAGLTAIAASLGQKKSDLSITFNASSAQVSSQLQASAQCPLADLIADARAQAQEIASGSGATVGPILALSDGSTGSGPERVVANFSIAAFSLSAVLFVSSPPANCTLTAQFSTISSQ